MLFALALGAGLAVFGLGSVADSVGVARVPEVTGPVVVRVEESLWQVARRAAPSGEPDAVVRRIVELNDLASPSVEAGRVLVSPIG
ncbi:MAG: LysM peptidoglycan-binding domain-containing protein [Pseudonocardia sp.]